MSRSIFLDEWWRSGYRKCYWRYTSVIAILMFFRSSKCIDYSAEE